MPKLRIMRVCPAPPYVQQFRKKYKLTERPFVEQVKVLQAEGVYLPGGWASYMENLGFEVFDALYDDYQLSAQWAEENNALDAFRGTNPLFDILTRQARQFRPDIIIFWTGGFYRVDRKHRMELRTLLGRPVVITGVWGDEIPYGETYDNYFGDVDFMFTVNSAYRTCFEEAGIRAYTMGSGFDESIIYSPSTANKHYDIIMCGDTGFNKLDHIHRYELLCQIAAATNIRIFASEAIWSRRRIASSILGAVAKLPKLILDLVDFSLSRSGFTRNFRITRAIRLAKAVKLTGVSAAGFLPASRDPRQNYFVRKKPLRRLFPRKVARGPLESSKYYELIAKSRIVLNIHRDEEADYGNLRVFEATGIGSLLLTDRGESLKEFFKIDYGSEDALETAEIATFTDATDCLKKIVFLLKNPEVANRIAENGRRRTLRDHTVRKRCEVMARALLEACADTVAKRAPIYVSAIYDTQYYPIGWDIAFFVEAAEITRKLRGADGTIVNILYPIDIVKLPGVPFEYDRAVDQHGREFRIRHICSLVANQFPGVTVNLVRDRSALVRSADKMRLIELPEGERPHHTEYYRMVNSNPHLVGGFTASPQAHRYVEEWLAAHTTSGKRVVCISIRDYPFDKQRNSNLKEWIKFIESLDKNVYDVVIVPDTDQMASYYGSVLSRYPAFWLACFDVDLRFALYETAFINLGVNNGPMTTCSLNKKVRYLMFKLVVPDIPHCTEEFIVGQGYPAKGSPVYGTQFQKWVWEDDNFPVIRREFDAMVRSFERAGALI